MPLRALLAAAFVFAAGSASASSPQAWTEFRTDVGARCMEAGKAQGMRAPRAVVHPFGSESYGVAVLIEGADKRICVYDKRTKAVELTPAP